MKLFPEKLPSPAASAKGWLAMGVGRRRQGRSASTCDAMRIYPSIEAPSTERNTINFVQVSDQAAVVPLKKTELFSTRQNNVRRL